jgi:lathosterol oxidase
MISLNSLKNFIITNGFLISLGFFQYKIISLDSYLFSFIVFIIRNFLLINVLDYITNKKQIINKTNILPQESYKGEFTFYVIKSTFIETLTFFLIKNTFISYNYYYLDIVLFPFISFLYEIIFDLFHYWTHRISHHRYLYRIGHKTHHKFPHPISILAYYHKPLDLLITNTIPCILTMYLLPKISLFMYSLILIYKTFIEISGHCGKHLSTGSFVQFIWLAKLLKIELYVDDHDLHHSQNNCNYAKRFSLWDKFFGTYKKLSN